MPAGRDPRAPRRGRAAAGVGLVLLLAFLLAPGWTHAEARHDPQIAELPARPEPVVTGLMSPEVRVLETATQARWEIAWDPWTGIAARGVVVEGRQRASAPPASRSAVQAIADGFRLRHARLLGAVGAELQPVRLRHAGRAWYATWQQRLEGRRVLGSLLDLVLSEAGEVVLFRSTLVPGINVPPVYLDAATALHAASVRLGFVPEIESATPVIAPVATGSGLAPVPAVELRLGLDTGWRGRVLVDARSAEVLECESLLRSAELVGTARALVNLRYGQDEESPVPLPWLRVRVGFGESEPGLQTHTDVLGAFALDQPVGPVTVRAGLAGLFVMVDNATRDPSPHIEKTVTVPGAVALEYGAVEARPDERTIYYHVNRAHDHLRDRYGFDLLDYPVPALAEVPDPLTGDPNYPNAYWNGVRLGFGNGGRTFYNMGLYADVIDHEYAHAVTDTIYQPAGGLGGVIGGAIHEALSDYFAAEMNGEPGIGEHLLRRTRAPLRNLDNQLFWPEDRAERDEVHANGLILGGALWDVHETVGADVAGAVIHFARELFPRTFADYLDAMLVQDDLLYGDGWPGNGSPHRDAILTAFAWHGIGPLAERRLQIQHQPLRDTEDAALARVVRVRLFSFQRECAGYARLSYRTNGDFVDIWLMPQADGSLATAIPPQPEGTRVEYYVAAAQVKPVLVTRIPDGAPDRVFAYDVGPDTTPPHIEHAPHPRLPVFAWPADLSVRIADNLGVAYAFVEYVHNGEPGPKLGLTPAPDDPDRYSTRFAGVGGRPGDVVEYWITAVDASRAGNQTRLPPTGSFRVELVPDLEEGFEAGEPSWSHRPLVSLHADPWHLTSVQNHTPGGRMAWWCGGESGEYPAGSACELVTDWYRIGHGAAASLWSWMDAETDAEGQARDGGRVEIQVEGEGEWRVLAPTGGYTHTVAAQAGTNVLLPGTPCLSGRDAAWRLLDFDLGAWSGARIRLRFVFGSDAIGSVAAGTGSGARQTATGHRGWVLDDFTLLPGSPDPTDAVAERLPRTVRVQVAPNPFNPRVTFHLVLPPEAGGFTLDILDSRGRMVRRLLDRTPARVQRLDLQWDGIDARGLASASGVYYYRLESRLGVEAGKLVLLR